MPDWPSIVQQYAPLVWQTVFRLVGREADAADCLQETFVSAMRVAQRQEVHHWAGLLQRLATARSLDLLRRRRRELQRRQGTSPGECDSVATAAPDPLASAMAGELAAELRQALAQLPSQQSEVFCLKHLNGFSYEQIADELGISVSAVGVNLHRARGRLRELLASRDASKTNAEESHE